MRKFKAESKKVLDLMINSIYTNKEIFLRELLSNASDAIDKLYFKSLQLGNTGLSRSDFAINITVDKEQRKLVISDNGIGMSEKELEENLGIIAKSGSSDFKSNNELKEEDINIIGQFGVGFYSAFMVADKVEVITKAHSANEAFKWESNGAEGYEITQAQKENNGTDIVLYLKADDDNCEYSKYLEEYTLKSLVKKYSNYIIYPIMMNCTEYDYDVPEGEEPKISEKVQTLNSMQPLWKKNKTQVEEEEYNNFYKEMFYDAENPLSTVHFTMEGSVDFKALLFIPAKKPYNFYSKEYEKGLKLYTNGVMITEKCEDLLPDYFSFVKGVVDTDIQLNLSRETVQQTKALKIIANSVEKKIKQELENLLANDREKYEQLYKNFGLQFKIGIYRSFGMNKNFLQDLLMFYSVKQNKMVTLKEYVADMSEDQKYVYYATGKTVDAIKVMPQLDRVIEDGYDVLCMTDDVDEFALKTMGEYNEKHFKSIAGADLGLNGDETDADDEPIAQFIKDVLGDDVEKVRISGRIKKHPVCFTAEGEVSLEMERVLSVLPDEEAGAVKAKKVLEINKDSKLAETIRQLFISNKDKLTKLSRALFGLAQLIEGMQVTNPTELVQEICELISE